MHPNIREYDIYVNETKETIIKEYAYVGCKHEGD